MKFEEVLILVRHGKKFEDFEHQVLSSGIWVQFSTETFTTWDNLLIKEFRLKSQKEIREFKFEGYLAEFQEDWNTEDPVDIALEASCTRLCTDKKSLSGYGTKISKWEFRMKELLE